jgi:hypothetical protein
VISRRYTFSSQVGESQDLNSAKVKELLDENL